MTGEPRGETIFRNARVVLRDRVLDRASVQVRNGRIADIDANGSATGTDLDGDWLMPGFVELHTDNLEKHMGPRPGVRWPAEQAVVAHDAQIAAAGIVTVFDAVGLGDVFERSDRVENLERMHAALIATAAAGALRAEHLIHVRCEVTYPNVEALAVRMMDFPEVRLASIMDHTPGQRQFIDEGKLRLYYTKKYAMTDEAFREFVAERHRMHNTYAVENRRVLVEHAQRKGIALASHDDATIPHVEEAIRDGMKIAEFPTTPEAAAASHEAGLAVLIGGPNLVLGGSHSGNVAAIDLARNGHVDIVSSDYVPASILPAALKLANAGIGIDMAGAIRTISLNPARSVGLDDRGEIAPGLRADLVRARISGDIAQICETWREGRRVV
jgi:alpha-D-ribose 1-methylphosphonate 5-triphosphate diphosphatase